MTRKTRGLSRFEIDRKGYIINNVNNLEKLRRLFLDRRIIHDISLGPGDKGDFDVGGWHILCHLAAGCAVFKKGKSFLWMEISHVPIIDEYVATVTAEFQKGCISTVPLMSIRGKELIEDSRLLGFVEGSSLGRISARDVCDDKYLFNKWLRQKFDNDVNSEKKGGRVWEHWCTTRDIRKKSKIGAFVLKAYLDMVSVCGGEFVSAIARGRNHYRHPAQLMALIKYGFITEKNALIDVIPKPISKNAEKLIYTADPKKCLKAVTILKWDENSINFFMFQRSISKWRKTASVKRDIKKLLQ